MAPPQTLSVILDLAIGASNIDLLDGQAQALVDEDSVCSVYASRESVDVTFQIKTGDIEAMPLGPCAVNATVGNSPSTRDNLIWRGTIREGQRLQVRGTNVNAAAQELKIIAQIVPMRVAIAMPIIIPSR